MTITTKTGDMGETGLFGGGRVSKDSDIIEAIGNIDELNSAIGVVWSSVETQNFASLREINQFLEYIQNRCFVIGAEVASIKYQQEERRKKKEESLNNPKLPKINLSDTKRLEEWARKLEQELPELHNFILPGGSRAAAELFLARAICRRAERSVVSLNNSDLSEVLKFLNRLSDLLFLLARSVNQLENKKEIIWSK